ncbi:hypothetical protein [Flexithrix dorotheae]|nr:hypothetical protein [Flexithrix dorotheae]
MVQQYDELEKEKKPSLVLVGFLIVAICSGISGFIIGFFLEQILSFFK